MNPERLQKLLNIAHEIQEQTRRAVAQSYPLCAESEKLTTLKNLRREGQGNPREHKAGPAEKLRQ